MLRDGKSPITSNFDAVDYVAHDAAHCHLKAFGELGWECKTAYCSEGLPKTEHFMMYFTSRELAVNCVKALIRTGQNLDTRAQVRANLL